jgi:hypothetical protein
MMKLESFRRAIRQGHIEWRKHSLQRLAERGIKQKAVIDVLLTGERIEDYPEDTPYPSTLFLGFPEGTPLHVVAAFDEMHNLVYIITAYEPLKEFFSKDYKTRRK